MPFSDFQGNSEIVHHLREMISRDHLPHALVLAGGRGAGKYTLALMLARVLNCLNTPKTEGLPDFCGTCANCAQIGLAADLDARFAEAVEARESLRETDKKETRIFVQTHPDVLVIPPDPPQMMIKVDQVRRVIETIYYRPAEGREKIYIFTDSAFMKEAANSLLKVLEEPPEFATIFLLARNPGELLPTIRSRSITFTLSALPASVASFTAALQTPASVLATMFAAGVTTGGTFPTTVIVCETLPTLFEPSFTLKVTVVTPTWKAALTICRLAPRLCARALTSG